MRGEPVLVQQNEFSRVYYYNYICFPPTRKGIILVISDLIIKIVSFFVMGR
jgi:hypothetical protein